MNVMERALRERIDPALTADALSELGSRALGTPLRARSARVLTGGCWNRVIAVRYDQGAPDLVFKISSHARAPDIEREFTVLRYFAQSTPMPVPRPYLLDASCRIIPGTLIVMERLPGEVLHAAYGRLSHQERSRVEAQIAEHVVELHRATSVGFGGVDVDGEARVSRWPDFWIPRFRRVLDEARKEGHLSPSLLDRVERSSERFDAMLDIGSRSTLTHYDIWSGNVIVDTANGDVRVSGFIDIPGNWADYAREISFMQMFGLADDSFISRYGATHELDPGCELRTSVYNLKMHMKHVSMYPEEVSYRAGVEACLRRIERAW